MTAFLFLPATGDVSAARRVDLADFASLFREVEQPAAVRGSRASVRRARVALLVLVLMLADTVLVARPDAFAGRLLGPPHAVSPTTI